LNWRVYDQFERFLVNDRVLCPFFFPETFQGDIDAAILRKLHLPNNSRKMLVVVQAPCANKRRWLARPSQRRLLASSLLAGAGNCHRNNANECENAQKKQTATSGQNYQRQLAGGTGRFHWSPS